MKRRGLIVVCLLLLTYAAHPRQRSFELKGRIVNDQQVPLSFATVTLHDMQGRAVVTTTSDTSGAFRLQYNLSGKYQISISHTGYTTYTLAAFDIANKDVGIIQLVTATGQLENVTVQSKENLVAVTAGSISYNVSKSIMAQGQTAFDALKQAPGIFINSDNTITLHGKAGVMILVDGKQVYLSGQELADMLRSMPASNVKSFEITASPGAKYDASGAAGIINIKTNKSLQNGTSGAATIGMSYGVLPKQNTEASFNYRNNKFNIYGGYSHFVGHWNYLYGSFRSQTGHEYNSATDDTDKRNRYAARLGIDYNINKKNTIGLLVNTGFVLGGGITNTTTGIADAATGVHEQTLYAENDYYFQRTHRYNLNANYRYEGAGGTTFNIDADAGVFNKSNGNLQWNKYTDPQQVLMDENTYRSLNDISIKLGAVKFDYTTPMFSGVVEAGAKYSSVGSVNNARFFHVISPADSLDDRRSNDFSFREQISAGYLSYKRTAGAWSYQAGLRMEHTRSTGSLTHKENGIYNNQKTPREYTNLFPSFSVAVKIKKHHNLSLAYSRRIDRPAYQDLNPFVYLLDELSFWQGNAFLQPQLSHRGTLQYAFKSKTIIAVNFSHTNRFSTRITDTTGINKIVMIPKNLGVQQNLSLSFTQNVTVNKWWQFTLNGTLYRLHNRISFDQYRALNLEQTAARFNMQQRFTLPAGMAAELNGFVNTKRLTGANQVSRGNSQVDIAVQKGFQKNKYLIRLALHDLYKGNKTFSAQNLPGFYLSSYGYYESRQVRLNFTYRFDNPNVKGPRTRNAALETENARIN